MKIFGAGMSGLMAAMANPNAIVYEKNGPEIRNHEALLRFRSEEVSKLTGIKFKEVKVIKSIWSQGKEQFPSPRLVSMYSKKNTGKRENRSIMNLEPVTRFIAPNNFQELLIEECKNRINFNYEITEEDYKTEENIISTLPLSVNAKMLGYDFKTEKNFNVIYVNKYEVENCDMNCTIYYPDLDLSVYRASIVGGVLIVESNEKLKIEDLKVVMQSYYIWPSELNCKLNNHEQPMGKLSGLNDSERRMMIYKMSHDHGVYSLGRFALHKNILLDDVAKDIRVIKEMMMDDTYGVSIKDRV